MHTYSILSLGLRIPSFEKFWIRDWLVKGILIAECVALHTIEKIYFCNLNLIFCFTFDSRFVFDPLISEITILLGIVCPSPIECILSAV